MPAFLDVNLPVAAVIKSKKNARFLKTGIDLKACIYLVNHSLAFTKASNQGETSSFLSVG
jgi:hypothetical protein